VHVEIADTGIGIPEERLKGLFDPDFDKNGTRVKVGKGSTFTVILPVDLKN
jgi:signal transduction histidine kinase